MNIFTLFIILFTFINSTKHNRTGKKCGNFKELMRFRDKYYPHSEIKYQWATQDCMSLDNVPYIGVYSKTTPDLYVATGTLFV